MPTSTNQRPHFNPFPWLMSGPALVVILLLMLYPIINLVLMSFRDYGSSLVDYQWVGVRWYESLPQDPRFTNGLVRTLVYSMASVAGSLMLGVTIAMLLNRNYVGVGLLRTLFTLPYTTMLVSAALVWNIMLNPANGIANHLLELVGLPAGTWLRDPTTVLPTLIMIQIWRSTPFAMLITLAGLRSLPQEPFEAAHIDGASSRQRLLYLTLPMLRAALSTAALFMFIDTLKQFPLIWVLTEGGPLRASETLYLYGYNLAFKFFDFGYGSAILVVLLAIILAISVVWLRLRRRAWV